MDEDFDKTFNRQTNFRHPTIDKQTQVRLLALSPNKTTQATTYKFHHVPLAQLFATKYKALSYTWGHARTADDTRQIEIDGQVFCVRRNLFDFLVASASMKEYGLLFIDAVCINQLDYDERRAQVRHMTSIFQSANEVIAWLGFPGVGESGNVQALSRACSKPRDEWTKPQCQAFEYLSHNPYWRRVWVVQEVLLASSMVVWCGVSRFPRELFQGPTINLPSPKTKFDANGRPSNTASLAKRLQSPAESIVTHRLRYVLRPRRNFLAEAMDVGTAEEMTAALKRPSNVVQSYQSRIPDQIHLVIHKFGKLECSDPSDRLYGLLGILSEHTKNKIDPDYKRGVKYAYYQALKVGLEECYPVGDDAQLLKIRGDICSGYFTFYCNVRDAFGMADETSLPILRRVLDELGFQTRAQDALFEAQWQQQFFWCELEMKHYKAFQETVMTVQIVNPQGEEKLLSKFHKSQHRLANAWVKWIVGKSTSEGYHLLKGS